MGIADEARTVPPAGTLPSRSDGVAARWALVSHNATLALAMVGLLLYGVVWTAYAIFFRAFGLTARDVGIEYSEMVQEAAVAVVVYAEIVVIVVVGHYFVLRAFRVRLPRSYKLGAIVVGAFAAVLYPSADAHFSARHAKSGDGLEVGGGSFPLPLGLPLSAPHVSARFSDKSVATASGIRETDCVLYLGATAETVVLWVLESDIGNGRVVRVPKRSTVIAGRSRNCARRR